MYRIVVFIVAQLLTVITSTIKSIATVKSSPTVAGIINAVAYTLNALIVKLITGQDIYIVLIVTFVSNLVGVPLGKIIMSKVEKERLWVYVATINCDDKYIYNQKKHLNNLNIPCFYQEIIPNKLYELKIYCKDKTGSQIAKNTLNGCNKSGYTTKYYIIEPI